MHLKITIGGRYTNVVLDCPIPIANWVWDKIYRKYFQAGDFENCRLIRQMQEGIEKGLEKDAEIEKLIKCRRLYEEANKMNGVSNGSSNRSIKSSRKRKK